MASHHGTITEFSGIAEDWEAYMKQLESYFVVNNITAAKKKRAVLLSSCGTSTYKIICSIIAPEKLTEVSYGNLTKKIQEHFSLKPSLIMQRFKFNTCVRHPKEKISVYVERLRELMQYCEFGDTIEDMLRDRLVCDVNEEQLQCRLLAEPWLTFQKALKLSQTFEAAVKDAKDLQGSSKTPVPINAVPAKTKGEQQECYQCGGPHNPNKCKYRESVCHNCSKKGHLAKKCRQR